MSESQSVLMFQTSSMSEKLCLKWNDFQENVNAAFGNLREDNEFADVTLACDVYKKTYRSILGLRQHKCA